MHVHGRRRCDHSIIWRLTIETCHTFRHYLLRNALRTPSFQYVQYVRIYGIQPFFLDNFADSLRMRIDITK